MTWPGPMYEAHRRPRPCSCAPSLDARVVKFGIQTSRHRRTLGVCPVLLPFFSRVVFRIDGLQEVRTCCTVTELIGQCRPTTTPPLDVVKVAYCIFCMYQLLQATRYVVRFPLTHLPAVMCRSLKMFAAQGLVWSGLSQRRRICSSFVTRIKMNRAYGSTGHHKLCS